MDKKYLKHFAIFTTNNHLTKFPLHLQFTLVILYNNNTCESVRRFVINLFVLSSQASEDEKNNNVIETPYKASTILIKSKKRIF